MVVYLECQKGGHCLPSELQMHSEYWINCFETVDWLTWRMCGL